MESITIKEILSATNGILLSGNTDQAIDSVQVDSRKIKKNSLFVPLKGVQVDGHDFIQNAFDLGASVCLTEQQSDSFEPKGALIRVDSTLEALQNLAKYYRSKFHIPVIGVTGSVGKTTTKEMLTAALGETLSVLKTQGNYNGQIGLPLSIFNLNSSHQVAILEMGISKFGEMDRLREIANPDIAVITNVGLSHIENFKIIQNTCTEKIKIINDTNKKLYINGDCPILSDLQEKAQANVVFFGINGAYPYKCEEICINKESTSFVLSAKGIRENITIPCLGVHNVYNAIAAIAIAMDMGIHLDDIKKGLLNFQNADMRQQILHINNFTLIDDSYNASPDSVKSSVSVFNNLGSTGKNILVIGDMLELGEFSSEIHFETGRYIATEKIDIIITVGEKAVSLAEGAKSVDQNIMVINCINNIEAYQSLNKIITPGDKILLKGSRGMHLDQISQWFKENNNVN